MTMYSNLVKKYWKLVHLPRGYMAFDKDGKCMMMLYQSENVRILVIRRPDAPNMYYVGVEVLKFANNLRLDWTAQRTPELLMDLSETIINSSTDVPDFLLDEIT
jgi:hypothetical protein